MSIAGVCMRKYYIVETARDDRVGVQYGACVRLR